MIKLVDVFAGPGGLGEGFTSFRAPSSRRLFEIAVSIEKDPLAHMTLRLRAFRRQFGNAPTRYQRYLQGEVDWAELAANHPHQAEVAEQEARCLELAHKNASAVRDIIDERIDGAEEWALIGGPPCQAYSLAGRARNAGNKKYKPEEDRRQTLYVEYLQILGDHAPPVFVMENVKGLLSAELKNTRMFQRILEDLSDPPTALKREGRKARREKVRYEIRPVIQPLDLFGVTPDSYVIRSEEFGIPQRRHRVVLLGVRQDLRCAGIYLEPQSSQVTAFSVLKRFPRVRSGISKGADSDKAWANLIAGMGSASWLSGVDSDVRAAVKQTIRRLRAPRMGRGGECLQHGSDLILNHSTRAHISGDLARYLFASAFALVREESPRLKDFPAALLPAHENVGEALQHSHFADRFRVQLQNAPATTITSHISKDGHYYIHPDPTQVRSLTVREAAALQTFPDDYFFCGPRTAQYHQVGNAVPPALARQIARVVAEVFGVG